MQEAYDSLPEEDPIKYAVGAMEAVPDRYTEKTLDEGNRVKAQLENGLSTQEHLPEFEYQGSVTNGTHIKFYSDIDLLVLHTHFFTVEPPGQPENLYEGDPIAELTRVRASCSSILRSAFPKASVDDSPGKAIALAGGSLSRKVEVIVSHWWNTVEYQRTGLWYQRGVRVFDSRSNRRIKNRPFLHNEKIGKRDELLSGSLRRVARLLKSLKYDADTPVDISSYDITSLAYRMPEEMMYIEPGFELTLVENAARFLATILDRPDLRGALKVPNEMRPIFGSEGASVEGLRQLYREIQDLLEEISLSLNRSLRKLKEARLPYW
jgi:hypothetical protein